MIILKTVLQWLVLTSSAAWYLQCNYPAHHHDDYEVRLRTLDQFQQTATRFQPDEPITFQLTLDNDSRYDLVFRFPTAQEYEFYVYQEDELVWQWSVAESLSFAQVISSHRVDGDESWTVSFTWDRTDNEGNPLEPGEYRVEGAFIGVERKSRNILLLP